MSVVVGIPKEQTPGERRIALVPDTVKRLTKLGATVVIEKGMGESAYFKDTVYLSRRG
jgi:NAD(P) transhydrogenase subunit alpha